MNIKKYLIFLLKSGKPSFPVEKNVINFLCYFVHSLIFLLLFCCALIYRIIVRMRVYLYRSGVIKRTDLPCPVISIGNITTGGTGKTPAVIEIARLLHQHGKRVVILSRGYRRDSSDPCYIVQADSDVQAAGDEPLLIAHKLPDIPVIVGSQRSLSGKMAIERFQPDVILLDDGFQHIQLARTLDLVLVDAMNPFGGGYMLPAGFLREPLPHLARANAFVITRSDEIDDITPIERELQRFNPNAPIFKGVHAYDDIKTTKTGESIKIDALRKKKLLAVSGLANPASFLRLLHSIELPPVQHLDFPDHHWYTAQDADMIRQVIARDSIEAIITTEKDETKLSRSCSFEVPSYVLTIKMKIQPDAKFWALLAAQGKKLPCHQEETTGISHKQG